MSQLEERFLALLDARGLKAPSAREYRFAQELVYVDKAGRKRRRGWRFDFAWLDERVAVEVEGGVYQGGRHTQGRGASRDAIKYNEAAIRGWIVLRFTVEHIERQPDLGLHSVDPNEGY